MTRPSHGTYTGYASHGCRCEACRQAKADYMRERRAAARVQAQRHTLAARGERPTRANTRIPGATRYLASNVKHGTRYAYEEHGCRCFDCTDARNAADRKYARRAS